jgi:hypothetical protein
MRTPIPFGALFVFVAACDDPVSVPESRESAAPLSSVSSSAVGQCGTPTVTVNNEASLQSAVSNAAPGTVIGVEGLIPVSTTVLIMTNGVTLTCASQGSGLVVAPNYQPETLLLVQASGVTVRSLVLDASSAFGGVDAYPGDDGLPIGGLVIVGNDLKCGSFECMLLSSTPAAVVAHNLLTANGVGTGLHIQGFAEDGGIDGTRVERNTIVATAPSTDDRWGAIRVLGGNRMFIAGNDVRGPWQNGIALSRVGESTIALNHLDGAANYGFAVTVAASGPTGLNNSVIRDNEIHRSGVAGLFLRNACFNRIFRNNLLGNAGNVGLIFSDPGTGGNVYLGSGSLVVDNGGFDCDEDGILDPNQISSQPATIVSTTHALSAGAAISAAIGSSASVGASTRARGAYFDRLH